MIKNCIATLAALCILMSGCATTPKPNMANSVVTTNSVVAPPDKALVYFVRPNMLGFLINAAVYDGDRFVGILPYGQKFPYVADAGEHMFMVISEAADFMKADLVAGKTYYVQVTPRMGAWKARFSLAPIMRADAADPIFQQKMSSTPQIDNAPSAQKWAEDNKPSVKQKKDEYWPKWNEKDEAHRPYLHADDGL